MANKSGRGYLPALDGLRALAVAGVVLYHAGLNWIPGGFLGVDVFFVLSGYLITGLLLREFGETGRVDFLDFYRRRARRLLPALFLLLGVVAIGSAFVIRDAAAGVRQDLPAALTFTSNWWDLVHQQSYFSGIGRPPLLQHLWSLGVEEQFYLLWPALALTVMRHIGRRGLGCVALSGAIASTVWMTWLSVRGGFPDLADPSRLYFGADTHAMGLMTGAVLACVWRTHREERLLSAAAARVLGTVGLLSLAGVGWAFHGVDAYSTALYRWGFLAVSVVTALVIASATYPGTTVFTMLSTRPMRWVGERSYGIYLWHWPVFEVTRPGVDIAATGAVPFTLRVSLTLILAALSYRYVEQPVRDGRAIATLRRLFTRPAGRRPRITVAMATLTALASLFAVTGASLVAARAPSAASILGSGFPTTLAADGNGAPPAGSPESAKSRANTQSRPASATEQKHPLSTQPNGPPRATSLQAAPLAGSVTIIGDSVVLGASRGLWSEIPGAHIDAAVGRQAAGILARIIALKSEHALAQVVVLHMGTNGIASVAILHAMLTQLQSCRLVVLVNAHVPRPWEVAANLDIARAVAQFSNATLANWYVASNGHPEYFVPDGVHLTGSGIAAFSSLVARTARS